jgi:hypothetical protein
MAITLPTHSATPCSRLHSSTGISLHCASCICGPFAPSYLGGTWSTSHRSSCVSLACLKRIDILGEQPPSLLLDHLIIPAGAKLTTQGASPGHPTEYLLPRPHDNLGNLPNFTRIHLYLSYFYPRIRFSGPNGKVGMVPLIPRIDATRLALESLFRFDTSMAERLRIDHGNPPSSDLSY